MVRKGGEYHHVMTMTWREEYSSNVPHTSLMVFLGLYMDWPWHTTSLSHLEQVEIVVEDSLISPFWQSFEFQNVCLICCRCDRVGHRSSLCSSLNHVVSHLPPTGTFATLPLRISVDVEIARTGNRMMGTALHGVDDDSQPHVPWIPVWWRRRNLMRWSSALTNDYGDLFPPLPISQRAQPMFLIGQLFFSSKPELSPGI